MLDFNLSVHPSAWAVAHLLGHHDGIETSWNDETKEYDAKINMAPWYNGRERGLVFVLHHRYHAVRKYCVAVVYEHRNSDNICVLHWESESGFLNPPTLDDIPEGKFRDKWDVNKSFPYNGHHDAAAYIYELFEKFCRAEF